MPGETVPDPRADPPGRDRPPTVAALAPEARAALEQVAARLAEAGHRVWLVGGAVRDLALGRQPKDLDLASPALPDEVERLFDRTVSVGREFGTVLVLAGGRELQHTTFRTEAGYADRRRPDRVAYGSSLEGDARRRDFTCNALYLDPLADEFRDPEGGLEDLRAGRLCAVGDPAERFREDGLRLIRMARFAARLDLEPAPELLAAARAEAGALEGVSPERTLGELERIFGGPRSQVAIGLLADCGLLARALPGLTWPRDPDARAARLAWLEALADEAGPSGPGLESGLAVVLADDGAASPPEARLEALHTSRATRRAVLGRWALLERLRSEPPAARADRVRLVREPDWPAAARLERARRRSAGEDAAGLEALDALAAALGPEDRFPARLLDAEDLARAGVDPGPRYAELFEALETAQLEGQVADREAALAWLRAQPSGGGAG